MRQLLRWCSGCALIIVVACADGDTLIEPARVYETGSGSSPSELLAADLKDWFATGDQREVAEFRVLEMVSALERADTGAARRAAFSVMRAALGRLGDDRGRRRNVERRARLAAMFTRLHTVVGLDAPRFSASSFDEFSAVGVVGASGGEVISETGYAGVAVPSGAFTEDVLIVMTRVDESYSEGQGPLNTLWPQYGAFYEIQFSPEPAQSPEPLTVGVCALEGDTWQGPSHVHQRLRMAASFDGGEAEMLESAPARWLSCATQIEAFGPFYKRVFDRVASWLGPRRAHAIDLGQGGEIIRFDAATVGIVDPGT